MSSRKPTQRIDKRNINKIKYLLDEDYFANKQLEMSEEERKSLSDKWFDAHMFVKKNLLKTGKISKITFNRWDGVIYRKYGYLRHELMMPSEYNKKMGIKPRNMKFFYNAECKIKNELSKLFAKNNEVDRNGD